MPNIFTPLQLQSQNTTAQHENPNQSTTAQHEGLSELAAALAHEIKNPAALALAHVTQLRKRADLKGIGDTCDHIEEALEKICCLAQEMLFVTYGPAPAYEFDLEDMLMDMLEAYQAAWPKITFALEMGGQGLMYYGEEACIKMVFSNLIKNAVEAIGETGDITVVLSRGADYITAAVLDSGGGGAVKPHAVSGGDAAKSHAGGGDVMVTPHAGGIGNAAKPHASGLGIPICKWLLARAGGEMELRTLPAGGTEARVLLPVRDIGFRTV